ncbi:MAG: BamA/TamA family outer membrane protein [Bacteroidaceae bacterium]|nr:BamA/TamA family outer membrane protein [Bacteroidaceae bacterium]
MNIKYSLFIIFICVLASCSTTSGLKEDEVLYTGIKSTSVEDKKGTSAESVALTEVEAALAYEPNNSFMGSSSMRTPLPIGLWIYNGLVDKQKTGFSKWLFNTFGSKPITLNMVNPRTRVQVAENLLQNYGYFRGSVNYEIVPQRNPKKAKIKYDIKLGQPYLFDSIKCDFPYLQDSILNANQTASYLKPDAQFSVADLQAEKDRMTSVLRNNGFYYYRPDYIHFYADSVNTPQRVKLLIVQDPDIPAHAQRQWYIGDIEINIRRQLTAANDRNYPISSVNRRDSSNVYSRPDSLSNRSLFSTSANSAQRRIFSAYTDSMVLRHLKYRWMGEKKPISGRVLLRNFRFRHKQLFSQEKVNESLMNMTNMKIFRNIQYTYTPRDTTGVNDTLDVRVDATMDKLVDAELDFNITQKSNSQVGPNASLTLSKRNAFGHGETFSIKLKGSYEWQTKSTQRIKGQDQINSYEAGLETSVAYPWLVFPGVNSRRFKYATSTAFKFDINHLNRSGYYRLLSFNTSVDYNFSTSKWWSHRVSPISLTYNKLENTTARFDSIAADNKALLVGLQNHFVPAMQYTAVYNNSWYSRIKNSTMLELSVKQAGNITSGIMSLAGKKWDEKEKKLFGCPYSQFLKLSVDLRNKFPLSDKSLIATRVFTGVLWCYGNSEFAPYSELFYVGGANDIRAFAAHSIGPGRYYDYEGRGTYLDQAGDLKLEANVEYRFPLVSQLYGALFVDAGNVWLLRKNESHPNGELGNSSFFDSMALGTGFGFRYDLDFLVLRFDVGIGLHAPYDTGKKGYYNIPKFWRDGVGLHFAVGYPF